MDSSCVTSKTIVSIPSALNSSRASGLRAEAITLRPKEMSLRISEGRRFEGTWALVRAPSGGTKETVTEPLAWYSRARECPIPPGVQLGMSVKCQAMVSIKIVSS